MSSKGMGLAEAAKQLRLKPPAKLKLSPSDIDLIHDIDVEAIIGSPPSGMSEEESALISSFVRKKSLPSAHKRERRHSDPDILTMNSESKGDLYRELSHPTASEEKLLPLRSFSSLLEERREMLRESTDVMLEELECTDSLIQIMQMPTALSTTTITGDSMLSVASASSTTSVLSSAASLRSSPKASAKSRKQMLMKMTAATMHLSIIGVLFGEAQDATVPLLPLLSPRSIRHAISGMSAADGSTEHSVFAFEPMLKSSTIIGMDPLSAKKHRGPIWSGVFVSGVHKTTASGKHPTLRIASETPKPSRVSVFRVKKKKSKKKKRLSAKCLQRKSALLMRGHTGAVGSLIGLDVSDERRTRDYDSFDSETVFVDESLPFRIDPFKYHMQKAKSKLELEPFKYGCADDCDDIVVAAEGCQLHPQIAYECFAQSITALTPGCVLLKVKQTQQGFDDSDASLKPIEEALKAPMPETLSADGSPPITSSMPPLVKRGIGSSLGFGSVKSVGSGSIAVDDEYEYACGLVQVLQLLNAVSVAPKANESSEHLFQVPLFPCIEPSDIRTVAIRMDKSSIFLPETLIAEAKNPLSKLQSEHVLRPPPTGSLICCLRSNSLPPEVGTDTPTETEEKKVSFDPMTLRLSSSESEEHPSDFTDEEEIITRMPTVLGIKSIAVLDSDDCDADAYDSLPGITKAKRSMCRKSCHRSMSVADLSALVVDTHIRGRVSMPVISASMAKSIRFESAQVSSGTDDMNLSRLCVPPLGFQKTAGFLDEDLYAKMARGGSLDVEIREARIDAPTKHRLMETATATIQVNVIGVLFEDDPTALPSFGDVTPGGLKMGMQIMAKNSSKKGSSLLTISSMESSDDDEEEEIDPFWSGVYVSAVLQSTESAPWLQPKHKIWARKKKKKKGSVFVSEELKTECFDSFDSELVFMDSMLRFRVPPFSTLPETAAMARRSHAQMNALHPQTAFDCFETLSAEVPGSVLLRVTQASERKKKAWARKWKAEGSGHLGVAMLYVRDLFEAVSVATKSERSKVHLFQLPLFEAVDNSRVKATALLMAKKGVSTAGALLREAADESTPFKEAVVKKPVAKGVLVCSVQFLWDV